MLKNLSENISMIFSLSLVMSYFSSCGYYYYYNVDISSYITVSDLTLGYVRFVWLTIPCVVFPVLLLYNLRQNLKQKISWWGESIFGGRFKRQALIIVPVMILIIVWACLSSTALTIVVAFGITAFYLIIVFVMLLLSYFVLKDESENNTVKDNLIILFITFMLVGVGTPFLCGNLAAKYATKTRVVIKIDKENKTIKSDNTTEFVGKTYDYFFIYNNRTNLTSAYRMDKVTTFTELP